MDTREDIISHRPPEALGPTVVDLFLDAASRWPGRHAVEDAGVAVTYAELDAWSSSIADRLEQAGAVRGCTVAVCLPRSAAEIASLVAVVRTGSAYMLVDPDDPEDRLARLLENAGARIVLSRPGTVVPAGVAIVDPGDAGGAPAHRRDAAVVPDDLAYVVHTSGSTGRPNAVRIPHSALANLVQWHRRAFSLDVDDRSSHLAGLTFDASTWEIWPSLCSGSCLVLAGEQVRTDPSALRDWMVREAVTVAFVPTPVAEPMLRLDWTGTALRFLLTGGDALRSRPPAGLPFVLVNDYGPSECCVVATSGVVEPSTCATASRVPSIGRPIDGVDVRILDADMRPVPDGVEGEICISGANVGLGYGNDPVLTAERFPVVDGVRIYRTGDVGRVSEDGSIHFVGRVDSQRKIRGVRVELGEIASVLAAHPDVVSAAADLRDGPAGPALAVWYVPAEGTAPTSEDLHGFLSGRLPRGILPSAYVRLERMPLTRHGKIDRAALPDPVSSGDAPADEAPRGYLEEAIAEIVAGILRVPSVSRSDDFFLMGGHSLLAAQLAARLRDAFGVSVSLRDLFDGPTVELLASLVDERLAGDVETVADASSQAAE